MRTRLTVVALVLLLGAILHLNRASISAANVGVQSAAVGSLNCTLTGYRASSGLNAAVAGDTLSLTWDADRNQELRLRFTINGGTPTIQELAVRRKGGAWAPLATNVSPEFRVVAGKRRLDIQAVRGLMANGVTEITPEVIEQNQWNAFWDAPLFIPGGKPDSTQTMGLPRRPDEVTRATASYQSQGCDVKTDGARLIVTFPGVSLGLFAGQLQYTVYKGSNLIQQAVLAKTEQKSVAYKYDAGLKGLAIAAGSRMVWRDPTNLRQDYEFGGATHERERPVTSANRLLIAERGTAGSIATFPPPHNFFWTRETSRNLGYNWYRKDSDTSFSFGIRQSESESEHEPGYFANFPLYNARPGTMQHMPVFFYATADPAEQAREAVLAFTHNDQYKALPGYKVMGGHYHIDFGPRLFDARNADAEIEDLGALKALGINIITLADRVGTVGSEGPTGPLAQPAGPRNGSADEVLKVRHIQIEGARRQSDKHFLIMLSHEVQPPPMGGHTDYLYSHPVYWLPGRAAGQPLVEDMPPYGKVYRIGSAEDLIEMANREDIIMSMPHPRAKTNTGFPDGFKRDAASWEAFRNPRYESIGYRWGMGLDRSERRLCEYRCLPLLDEMANWFADDPAPPKHLLAISEAHHQYFGNDIYSFSPITYVKLASLPTPDDASLVITALRNGDSFVSTGEILIPAYSVQGTGNARRIVADLEWTFPLDFVEVVWGDGQRTDRQIISTTEMPAFGRHRFEIPFDATGKKWVRFAAWDAAGNGALSQPVKLAGTVATR